MSCGYRVWLHPPPSTEVVIAVVLLVVAGLNTILYMRPQTKRVAVTDLQKRLLGIPDNGNCSHVMSCDL